MFEKITDFGENCVSSAPDVLNGTPAENKAWFDKAVKNVVAAAFNELIDTLSSADAPAHIGAEGGTLQDKLESLSDEIDSKIESVMSSCEERAAKLNTALSDKVDKDGEKVLSDNNYLDEDKAKLDGIETYVENAISSATAAVEDKIPTKVSQLTNDIEYADKAYVDGLVADIETGLDNIISIQNSLIGGDA